MTSKSNEPQRRKVERATPAHTDHPELATFIQKFWHRNEPPERMEVYHAEGRNKSVRGDLIFSRDFKPAEKIQPEDAAELANEMTRACQDDCNARARKSTYLIAVKDLHQGSNDLIRLLGPLNPMLSTLENPDGSFDDDEDSDSEINPKSKLLRYIDKNLEVIERSQNRMDQVIGDTLMLQRSTIQQQQVFIADLMARQMEFFNSWQAAEDRKDDRSVRRAMTELKVTGIKEAMRSTRMLLPALFGNDSSAEKTPETQRAPSQPTKNESTSTQSKPSFPHTKERLIVSEILKDCEELNLTTKLFGEWEQNQSQNWVPVAEQPGIFTPQQFEILLGVSQGMRPAADLDVLMPGSNHQNELTSDQLKKAQEVLPESMQMALLQLVALRKSSS